ncbi:PQQ-dependent sugar dehydrogenase [Phormidesmis priestleyi ANT.L61.2]
MVLARVGIACLLALALQNGYPAVAAPPNLTPHRINLANGKTFSLNLPENYQIRVAAQGLKRIRFMAKSPDDRLFVTDMYDLTDNRKGTVYVLDRFDSKTGKFGKITPYLKNLRNPNSVAFYVDSNGNQWLYLALTDRLVRYRYSNGETAPKSAPQVLAKFPDYGLSYKYGGWHLTRTVVIHNDKVYVALGSSCNACEEKESVRASILEMDLNGKNQKAYANGLRNAVGIKWANNQLYATNMGADHLGDNKPEETFYRIKNGQNYGFPYCYQYQSRIYSDDQFKRSAKKVNCSTVPLANATFPAHSAPLGLEYFDSANSDELKNSFLVALHGSSKLKLQRGYQVSRLKSDHTSEVFINGFLQNGTVYGRPVDILRVGKDAFLLTDDYAGVIYYISKK